MYPNIANVCDKMTEYVQLKMAINDNTFDARELASKFTIDNVSSCIYGIDSKAFTNDVCEIRDIGGEILKPTAKFIAYFTACAIFPFLKKIWKMPFVTKRVENYFTQLMNDAIDMRKKLGIERNDYLSYLFELKQKKNLSELDMAAHTISFFLDGFETSSSVIAHALYLLAMNKNEQVKLRQAINEAIGKNGGSLTFESIQDIEYLDHVFNGKTNL